VTTWLAVVALGAYHGINPAMGWLFAVALGLQQRRRGAVLGALPAIALGHEASVAVVVALVYVAEFVAAAAVLRVAGAVALVLFGLYKLLKPRSHPRWVGMRVSRWDLVVWSFLMSSAHGAGLMLFPILVHNEIEGFPTALENLLAVSLHTAAMLVTMAAIALLVYEKLGVGVLRKAWLNLDAVWATAIIAAGAVTLFT
jgi:hypothetical protein